MAYLANPGNLVIGYSQRAEGLVYQLRRLPRDGKAKTRKIGKRLKKELEEERILNAKRVSKEISRLLMDL